jgi:hypothetical protein
MLDYDIYIYIYIRKNTMRESEKPKTKKLKKWANTL